MPRDPFWNWPLIPSDLRTSTEAQTVSVARLRHKVPGKALAAFQRAIKFASRKEWGKGAKELENSVAVDPDFSDAHGNLGIHYIELGRLDEAVNELHRAIALDSGCSVHHSNLAAAYLLQHDPSDARTEAETAVALDSTNIRAQYMLGALLAQDPQRLSSAQWQPGSYSSTARPLPATIRPNKRKPCGRTIRRRAPPRAGHRTSRAQ